MAAGLFALLAAFAGEPAGRAAAEPDPAAGPAAAATPDSVAPDSAAAPRKRLDGRRGCAL